MYDIATLTKVINIIIDKDECEIVLSGDVYFIYDTDDLLFQISKNSLVIRSDDDIIDMIISDSDKKAILLKIERLYISKNAIKLNNILETIINKHNLKGSFRKEKIKNLLQ